MLDLVYFATQVLDTSNTSVTPVPHERQLRNEWDMSDISATRLRHQCEINDTSATQVKNFDIHNDTSENIFSHLYISFMASGRLQGEEKIHFKNYVSEMLHSHPKMNLKKAPQKLNLVMMKTISKNNTLDCSCKCSCTFPHSYM